MGGGGGVGGWGGGGVVCCFFFNDTATTEIYTLSLHDALPISYFTEDPDKAKFYAGIIGLASLVIIALSWADYSREMIVSAILTSVSSWSYIRSSQMK